MVAACHKVQGRRQLGAIREIRVLTMVCQAFHAVFPLLECRKAGRKLLACFLLPAYSQQQVHAIGHIIDAKHGPGGRLSCRLLQAERGIFPVLLPGRLDIAGLLRIAAARQRHLRRHLLSPRAVRCLLCLSCLQE